MYELRAKSSKETDILMYGSISEWGRVRAEDLYRAIDDAKTKGYETVNLKLNSPGGSIFEGIAILSQMNREDMIINVCVEGLAASMGSAVLQGAHRRKMVRAGRLMVHAGSGGVIGSVGQIRDYADLLESLNKTLADIYAKRTKKDAKWILDNWMAEGKNKWFTAAEALKEGLIDEIVEGNAKPLEKEEASLMEMAAHYSQFLTDTTETEMNKTELIAMLGLKADATDAEIKTALAELKAKADKSPTPLEKKKEEKKADDVETTNAKLVADSVVEVAKAKGVTDEKLLAAIGKLAEVDAKSALDLIPAQAEAKKDEEKSISLNELVAHLKGEKTGDAAVAADRKNWALKDWEQKDSAGLMAMIKDKPSEYQKLFKAAHGVEASLDELKNL